MGVAWALALQLHLPELFTRGRVKGAEVAVVGPPMKTSPPAVTMEPPRLGIPVLGTPRWISSSTTPSGTFQTISPEERSTALSVPQGGS